MFHDKIICKKLGHTLPVDGKPVLALTLAMGKIIRHQIKTKHDKT